MAKMKKRLTRDIGPYKIAKYLTVVEGVNTKPQKVYGDVRRGKLPAYIGEDGKLLVKKEDAVAYIERILAGGGRTNDDPWE